MIKQKDFVISEVKRILGTKFTPFVTKAILTLSANELELIKESTFNAILAGTVDYSKPNDSYADKRTYARSMVINHLKKSRELNGNLVYSNATGQTKAVKANPVGPKGINTSVLPEELQEYVRQLV